MQSVMPSTKSLISAIIPYIPQPSSIPPWQSYILYKLAIDVHEFYAKLFGAPLFIFYQNEVLPLALEFYSVIDENCLNDILDVLKRIIGEINNTGILLLRDKKEFINNYKKAKLSFKNLTEGYSVEMFYI